MSKVEKMRGRLASMQQDREDFERQKRELEAQMSAGRKNMDKIQKGLRNNIILNDPELLEGPVDGVNMNKRMSRKDMKGIITSGAVLSPTGTAVTSAANGTSISSAVLVDPSANGAVLQAQVIIPTGPRISDWCFTGAMDSAPPIVKSREMYENIRLLGRGAFGEVNLVKNVEDNKLFAIKTIFCSKDHDLEPVLREIRFLRASRHPCIIDVHDAFITTNPRVVHIVMHYCESGSLASVISSTKKNKTFIAEAQVLKWVVQLTLALNFLHERKVLHRDIKPMNIMLTEGGDLVKIADFGLAMNIEDSSDQSNMDEAGTPYYTAPEMIQRANYSSPADCWSFGVILHQLLALERPFDGSSTADLVKAILTVEPPLLPSHYSEEIKNISKGLLEKNPNQRLSTRTILCDPLVFPKVANFPQVYRPRNLEERIRRSHLRLLEQQIELVQRTRRASSLAHQSSTRSKSELSLSSMLTSQPSSSSILEQSSPLGKTFVVKEEVLSQDIEDDSESATQHSAQSPVVRKQQSIESPIDGTRSPKGGRIGSEIAHAIEHDQLIAGTMLSSQQTALH